jgi:hypothetical protein
MKALKGVTLESELVVRVTNSYDQHKTRGDILNVGSIVGHLDINAPNLYI